MKLLTRILCVAVLTVTTACTDDDAIPMASDNNPNFLNSIEPEEEVVLTLTQSEALDLWSNGEARLISVIKPETAIRRWWKAFTITIDPAGEYVYTTIEDDVIPANGQWTFAFDNGLDIVFFNDDEEEGELFERHAEVTFKTSSIGTTRFELKIHMIPSDQYNEALVGEWTYVFQL